MKTVIKWHKGKKAGYRIAQSKSGKYAVFLGTVGQHEGWFDTIDDADTQLNKIVYGSPVIIPESVLTPNK